MLSFQISGS